MASRTATATTRTCPGTTASKARPTTRRLPAQRRDDVRALLATLFASRGTIMLTAGDEFGRTQHGNNNAYAQDNAITWLDWAGRDTGAGGFRRGAGGDAQATCRR